MAGISLFLMTIVDDEQDNKTINMYVTTEIWYLLSFQVKHDKYMMILIFNFNVTWQRFILKPNTSLCAINYVQLEHTENKQHG